VSSSGLVGSFDLHTGPMQGPILPSPSGGAAAVTQKAKSQPTSWNPPRARLIG